MNKLVQKVAMDIMDISLDEMYIYGNANLEENLAMQEPLEKLYQYENQPNMRENVVEYIGELKMEIKRVEQYIVDNEKEAETTNNMLLARCQTLQEVINDLKGRLEERV